MSITTQQFFKFDFAEAKLTLCADVISLVKDQYRQLHRSETPASARICEQDINGEPRIEL